MGVMRGTSLCEVDFSAIEAVLVGWFARDPDYIRLAKLGVHSGLASHILGTPFNPEWLTSRPADLKAFLSDVKKRAKATPSGASELYDVSKRVVHGCLPGDHEVLTPSGWQRLDTLKRGTLVAQWETGAIRFVTPSRITNDETERNELLCTLEGRGLQIQMTADHRVPVKLGGGGSPLRIRAAKDVRRGKIPVSGIASDNPVRWSASIGLAVACQADGTCYKAKHWRFHLVRPRKVARLRQLAADAGARYRETPCGCHPTGLRIDVTFDASSWLTAEKHFRWAALWTWAQETRLAFLTELLHWDGSTSTKGHATYLTTVPENARFVQTVAHLSGRQGLLRVSTNRARSYGRKPLYSVSFNRRRWASVESLVKGTVAAPARVYCVTVPSGFFLVRFRDTISVTGNSAYCLTPHGMVNNFPTQFPTIALATKYQKAYFQMAPTIPAWQKSVQKFAYDHGYLGGPGDPPFGHPFAYKHWFWAVASYKKISEPQAERRTKNGNPVAWFHGQPYAVELGEDAKRSVAFYPQSTGRGMLTEAMLRLFDPIEAEPYNSYIGDAYFGRTPLRAPIHDSLFLEFPRRIQDRALEIVIREMTRPCVQLPNPASWGLGEYLVVDVEAKVGQAWSAMETVEGFAVGESSPYEAALASDEEDVEALQVSVA